MWENYEEARSERPYLWLAFILLLLLLGSIFVFRPSIPEQNSDDAVPSVAGLVLTTVDQTEHGRPVLIKTAATGIWAVHASPPEGKYLVRFLSHRGSEQWADTAGFTDAVMDAQGNFLAIAGLADTRVYVYHVRHRLVSAFTVPGEVQGVAVSEQGEVLVAFTVAEAEPLKLRTEAARFSSQGQQMWRHSLHEELPLLSEKAANGQISALVNLTLGTRVGAMLTILGRHGETILRSEIAGQPRHLLVHSEGGSVVVGTVAGVHVFDIAGGERSFYEIPGVLSALRFFGENCDIFFSADSRSVFNFRQQTVLGVLRNGKRFVWRERINERALFVSVSPHAPALLVGTATEVILYTEDGQRHAGIKHAFGEDYLAVNLDGTNDLVLSGTGQVVQLRGE